MRLYIATLTDKNGSTRYVAEDGSLTSDRTAAERYFTKEMAELFADPANQGIPASRRRALEIVGFAEPIEQ